MTVTTFLSILGDLAVGMASPHLLLLCVWNRSWSKQKNVGGSPRPGLASPCHSFTFAWFYPVLCFSPPPALTSPPLLPVEALARREPQGHAKAREMVMVEPRSQGYAQTNGPVRRPVWGWASLALILCRKFSDMYLGIALSVSVEEECKEIAVWIYTACTPQDKRRWVVTTILSPLRREHGRKLSS